MSILKKNVSFQFDKENAFLLIIDGKPYHFENILRDPELAKLVITKFSYLTSIVKFSIHYHHLTSNESGYKAMNKLDLDTIKSIKRKLEQQFPDSKFTIKDGDLMLYCSHDNKYKAISDIKLSDCESCNEKAVIHKALMHAEHAYRQSVTAVNT